MKLIVKELCKSFNDKNAVSNISFETEPGKIFGLLGPNGAGKTTTIRMIMNILSVDSGEIVFDGEIIDSKYKDRIGYLPEERGVYKKDKVNDMLLYFASLKGKTSSEAQPIIDEWLKKFDLFDWKYSKLEELSKGMSQKVQFISAIAHNPDMIFLDEPFSGLDPISTDILRESIDELSKKGKTILFSTHIMEQAEKICDKILVMNNGKEVISGKLSKVKEDFGNKTVHIEFDGEPDFIEKLDYVNNVIKYPRFIEIELKDSKYSDQLLKDCINEISIKKYEIVTPSLHKIFVSKVGEDNINKN